MVEVLKERGCSNCLNKGEALKVVRSRELGWLRPSNCSAKQEFSSLV